MGGKVTVKAIFAIFTTQALLLLNKYSPNPEEIRYMRGLSLEEIRQNIQKTPNEFAPTFRRTIEEFMKNITLEN